MLDGLRFKVYVLRKTHLSDTERKDILSLKYPEQFPGNSNLRKYKILNVELIRLSAKKTKLKIFYLFKWSSSKWNILLKGTYTNLKRRTFPDLLIVFLYIRFKKIFVLYFEHPKGLIGFSLVGGYFLHKWIYIIRSLLKITLYNKRFNKSLYWACIIIWLYLQRSSNSRHEKST